MKKLFLVLLPTLLGIFAVASFSSSSHNLSWLHNWLRGIGLQTGQPEPIRSSGCHLNKNRADFKCTNGFLVSFFSAQTACTEYAASGLQIPSKASWGRSLHAYGISSKQTPLYQPAWLVPEALGGADRWNNLFPLQPKAWKKWSAFSDKAITAFCRGDISLKVARHKLISRWSWH
jgi:hypothetical protein